jgi:peptide/nickel transport system substrate-binding protein
MASYTALDDYTVQIKIKQYENTWFGKLGGYMGLMISPSWVEKMGVEYVNWHPVGTGPFKFVSYKENEKLVTERFDDYWGGKPLLDGAEVLYIADPVTAQIAFEAGEGDVISVMAGGPQMGKDLEAKGYKIDLTPLYSTLLVPSVENPESPLSNVKVRAAMEYAVNKVALATNIGMGYFTPLYQYASSMVVAWDPNFQGREYDPDKAKQLLAEAGFPNGFKTNLYCGVHLAGDELPVLKSYWEKVGVDADIQLISVAKWIEMETNGWPEGLMESPTAFTFNYGAVLLRYAVRPTEPNWSRGLYWDSMYRPDELENAIQAFLLIPDTEGQIAKGREIAKIIYDNVCVIPLWENQRVTVLQPSIQDFRGGFAAVLTTNWNYTGTWFSKD